jgi:hypothetical protein
MFLSHTQNLGERTMQKNSVDTVHYLTTPDQLPSLFSDLWYDTMALHVELEGNENLLLKFQ